jgi:hypothetical protein
VSGGLATLSRQRGPQRWDLRVLLAAQIGFALAFAPCEALADAVVPAPSASAPASVRAGGAISGTASASVPAGGANSGTTDPATDPTPSEDPATTPAAGEQPGTESPPGPPTGGTSAPETGTGEQPDADPGTDPSTGSGQAPVPSPGERPCDAASGAPAAAEQPCPEPTPGSDQPAAEQPAAEPPEGDPARQAPTATPVAARGAPPGPQAHRPATARAVARLPDIAITAPVLTSGAPRAGPGGHGRPSPPPVGLPTRRGMATAAGSAWLTPVAPAPPDRMIASLGRRSRAGVDEGADRPAGAGRPPRLDSQPTRHSPITPPLERTAAAASAAGSSGSAQQALSSAMFLVLAALAAHELRRFRFRMLVPVAPGAPSLRDRPG